MPLEIIHGNSKSKPSARIERWELMLQQYGFSEQYKPGMENPGDYLLRYCECQSTLFQEKLTEEYLNFVSRFPIPKSHDNEGN